MSRLTIALLLAYLAVLCFCASTTLQAEALFLHRVSRVWPPCDLDHPEAGPAVAWLPWTSRLLQLSEGLPRTDAHRLPIGGEGGGGWAGLWHTRPGPVCEPPPGGGTWVLHLHGNGEARCWAKTARKTALLAAPPFCAHVVSIDYRGFADTPSASGAPSAASLLADALAALDWVHRAAGGSAPVVVYGHSLGSHVALAAAAHRCGRGGDSGGGGGGVPLFSAEPTLGRELSVLRRCTSALDDVTLKWRAVCVGPGGALPSELFVEAAYATISVFDSLGSAVGGCKKDMKRNADTLHASLHKQRQPGTYAASTLQQMVRAEVAELGVASAATGKSGSSDAATLALLWLARFLRVLEKLLAATSADSAAPLGPCISAAYASALQPHHTWVTQSVIVRALKFSSTREEFYGKLGADKAAAEQGVRDLLAVYSPPLAALQAFMLAEGLEKSDA